MDKSDQVQPDHVATGRQEPGPQLWRGTSRIGKDRAPVGKHGVCWKAAPLRDTPGEHTPSVKHSSPSCSAVAQAGQGDLPQAAG
eukprot:1552790-Pyramimonas_sp.AAC.1